MTRERKVKLHPVTSTDEAKLTAEQILENRQKNVSLFATARINKAANAIKVFGNCYGSKYEWTPEQIDKAEAVLYETVETAIKNIRIGKEIVAAGITL